MNKYDIQERVDREMFTREKLHKKRDNEKGYIGYINNQWAVLMESHKRIMRNVILP